MSAIDSFEHAHVGSFFNLPIYWVLNQTHSNKLSHLTDCDNDDDTIIDQYSLSVGGGSGEHPALIFNNDAVLFQFILDLEEIKEPQVNATESEIIDYQMYQLAQKIDDDYFDKENNYNNQNEEICYWTIDQNQWPLETFIEISEKWGKTRTKNDLAKNIIKAIALFIIHEMPLEHCLKNEDLVKFAKMYRSQSWKNIFNKEKQEYLTLAISPIKGNQKCGKIIRDYQTVWGYSLEDWLEDNKPLIEKAELEEKILKQSSTKKIKL